MKKYTIENIVASQADKTIAPIIPSTLKPITEIHQPPKKKIKLTNNKSDASSNI